MSRTDDGSKTNPQLTTTAPSPSEETARERASVADHLERALAALDTPDEWHWKLWHDIHDCLCRAQTIAATTKGTSR